METIEAVRPEQARFGALLKRFRLTAGLSQEALAERAGLSVQAIGAYERGLRQAPYRDTVRLLVKALRLTADEAAALEGTISRRRDPVAARASSATFTSVAPLLLPRAHLTNLPPTLTSFIGREQERREVPALLENTRLVTLTGAGGVGKTRLAFRVAEELLAAYPGGVWLAELAALADPTLLPAAVATVLGLGEEERQPSLTSLIEHLAVCRMLLVLDNCEHLVEACAALVGALLWKCPYLRILATSREALGVAGERLYRVPSLAVPDLAHLPAPEDLSAHTAVALFVARAQERKASFTLSAATARAVAEICVRLDGMPLAIELAAARVGGLPLATIAARLDNHLRLLTTGPRTAVPRQRTLRATLDWSYDLLSEPERTLMRRLTVFVGGWTLEAAEVVCTGDSVPAWAVLDLLDGLVNKSIVLLDQPPGSGSPEEARYRMLESVRQYGREHLEARGEAQAASERLFHWCLALAQEAESLLDQSGLGLWVARLEVEHDNLRAALRWSLQDGDLTEAVRMVTALTGFWTLRGYLLEGCSWITACAERTVGGPADLHAAVLKAHGDLLYRQGDHTQASAAYEAAIALYRRLELKTDLAAALTALGDAIRWSGEYARSAAALKESIALFRALDDQANAIRIAAKLARVQRDPGHARLLIEEALSQAGALGDSGTKVSTLGFLAIALRELGDYAAARSIFEICLATARRSGSLDGLASTFRHIGRLTYEQGCYLEAEQWYAQALGVRQRQGYKSGIATALEGIALARAARGGAELAAELLSAADALRHTIGVTVLWSERAAYRRALATIRASLGEDSFLRAWVAGQARTCEEAATLALESQIPAP